MSRPGTRPFGAGAVTTARAVLRTRSGRLGAALSSLIVVAALVSLVWTPYDPTKVSTEDSWAPMSGRHWLGADRLGRDLFSQLLAGAQVTLFVAVGATALAAVVGLALALLATVTSRPVGEGVAHLLDVLIAFPPLLIALVLAAVYPGRAWTILVALGLGLGVQVARVTRGEIRRVLASDYVLAARAAGAGTWRIIRRHLLPNITPTLYIQLSLMAGIVVLTEAALSYLGLGTPSPRPSWGRSLHELQPYLTLRPLVLLWPGLAVVLTVLGFNLLGDGLREAADPRLRYPARATPGPATLAAATPGGPPAGSGPVDPELAVADPVPPGPATPAPVTLADAFVSETRGPKTLDSTTLDSTALGAKRLGPLDVFDE
ncbi:ABC transporter permease [Frankia nepalensis]|uniref:ABC transporter permease n=1 Tax=Frankia nepalensis TaxID=1836974 RepID=UPI001EE4922C|nr:ABC transporter permease [Frankia nepalensis]